MENYDDFELQQTKQREVNDGLLDQFTIWLESTGISEKTVAKHVSNIDFYINEYLLYDEFGEPASGIESINGFFAYWFPRKAMWSSPAAVKSNCASFKKFYAFMLEKGEISSNQLTDLNQEIKANREDWLSCYDQEDDFYF